MLHIERFDPICSSINTLVQFSVQQMPDKCLQNQCSTKLIFVFLIFFIVHVSHALVAIRNTALLKSLQLNSSFTCSRFEPLMMNKTKVFIALSKYLRTNKFMLHNGVFSPVL